MKTVSEIKETIEETKHHLKTIRSGGWEKGFECDPPGAEEAEGWINALEWVLEDEPIADSEFNDLLCERLIELAEEKKGEIPS